MSNHTARVDLKGMEIADGSGHASRFDWAAMKADYLANRSLTMKDIAAKYGCSEISVKKHSQTENWVSERAAIHREFVRSTTEANLRKQAKTALQFNEDVLTEAMSLLYSIKEEHENLKAAGELRPNELGKLTTALKTTLETGRLALGLSTNNSEHTGKDGAPLSGELSKDDIHAELIALLGEESFNLLVSKTDDPVQ
jgi:hypothetical protein